jgi:hypothetical protein
MSPAPEGAPPGPMCDLPPQSKAQGGSAALVVSVYLYT